MKHCEVLPGSDLKASLSAVLIPLLAWLPRLSCFKLQLLLNWMGIDMSSCEFGLPLEIQREEKYRSHLSVVGFGSWL